MIVARVLRGDVEVFRVLVERYRDRYARYAFHMLGNREDAEEALQDAFTRAYRSLARCEDPERFGAWLFRILVNRCRTLGRGGDGARGRSSPTKVALLEAAEDHPGRTQRVARGDRSRAATLRAGPAGSLPVEVRGRPGLRRNVAAHRGRSFGAEDARHARLRPAPGAAERGAQCVMTTTDDESRSRGELRAPRAASERIIRRARHGRGPRGCRVIRVSVCGRA